MDVEHSFENILSATRLQGVTTKSAKIFTNYLPTEKKISEESY